MDLNEREAANEKGQKQYLKLKETFKNIFNGTLLNEKKLVTDAGKKLLKNVTKLKEEDTEETKKDEVIPDAPAADAGAVPPVAGDVPPVDAGAVPPVAGDVPPVDPAAVPPAPLSVDAPEGTGMVNSQDQLSTTEFVKQFMKGLPSDINMETSVDANGIFKAPVNDQHEGQFVVLVYPATKNVHEVADLLEPALPAPAAIGDVPPAVDAGGVPPVVDPAAVPPVDAGAVPPAAPADASPLDAPAGDVPPAEVPVEPKDDEDELKEDTVCENEKCMDESCKTHGGKKMMEAECEEEDEEAKLEKQRDPMMEGRKNWKAYQKVLTNKYNAAKLLKEEAATAEKKELGDVEKAERRVAAIKKQIEDETDAEEKKALKADLEKAESALNKVKTSGHNKKALDKVVDSIPRKGESED
jgi:hypothetical protein